MRTQSVFFVFCSVFPNIPFLRSSVHHLCTGDCSICSLLYGYLTHSSSDKLSNSRRTSDQLTVTILHFCFYPFDGQYSIPLPPKKYSNCRQLRVEFKGVCVRARGGTRIFGRRNCKRQFLGWIIVV